MRFRGWRLAVQNRLGLDEIARRGRPASAGRGKETSAFIVSIRFRAGLPSKGRLLHHSLCRSTHALAGAQASTFSHRAIVPVNRCWRFLSDSLLSILMKAQRGNASIPATYWISSFDSISIDSCKKAHDGTVNTVQIPRSCSPRDPGREIAHHAGSGRRTRGRIIRANDRARGVAATGLSDQGIVASGATQGSSCAHEQRVAQNRGGGPAANVADVAKGRPPVWHGNRSRRCSPARSPPCASFTGRGPGPTPLSRRGARRDPRASAPASALSMSRALGQPAIQDHRRPAATPAREAERHQAAGSPATGRADGPRLQHPSAAKRRGTRDAMTAIGAAEILQGPQQARQASRPSDV